MAKEAGSSTFFWTLVALIGVALVFVSLNPAMTGYAPRTVSSTSGDSWVGEVNRLYLKIAELEKVVRDLQQSAPASSGTGGGSNGMNKPGFESQPGMGNLDKDEFCPTVNDWLPTPSPVTSSNANQLPPLFCFSTDPSLPCWPDNTFPLGPHTVGCQYDRFVFYYNSCNTETPPDPVYCQNAPVCNKPNDIFSTENAPFTGTSVQDCAQDLGPICSKAASDAIIGCDWLCANSASTTSCQKDSSYLGAAVYGCDPVLDIAQCDIYMACTCK